MIQENKTLVTIIIFKINVDKLYVKDRYTSRVEFFNTYEHHHFSSLFCKSRLAFDFDFDGMIMRQKQEEIFLMCWVIIVAIVWLLPL